AAAPRRRPRAPRAQGALSRMRLRGGDLRRIDRCGRVRHPRCALLGYARRPVRRRHRARWRSALTVPPGRTPRRGRAIGAAMPSDGLPSYAELRARSDAPAGTSWGLFGPDDQLGTLNFVTPERVRASAALVVHGRGFSLNWPVEWSAPSPFRKPPVRTQVGGTWGRDDYLDRFSLQGSSQWDGLRHIAHPRYGFYNHTTAAQVDDPGSDRLGIQVIARRGIVARGVLLDVPRHRAAAGRPLAAHETFVNASTPTAAR